MSGFSFQPEDVSKFIQNYSYYNYGQRKGITKDNFSKARLIFNFLIDNILIFTYLRRDKEIKLTLDMNLRIKICEKKLLNNFLKRRSLIFAYFYSQIDKEIKPKLQV